MHFVPIFVPFWKANIWYCWINWTNAPSRDYPFSPVNNKTISTFNLVFGNEDLVHRWGCNLSIFNSKSWFKLQTIFICPVKVFITEVKLASLLSSSSFLFGNILSASIGFGSWFHVLHAWFYSQNLLFHPGAKLRKNSGSAVIRNTVGIGNPASTTVLPRLLFDTNLFLIWYSRLYDSQGYFIKLWINLVLAGKLCAARVEYLSFRSHLVSALERRFCLR